MIYLVASIAFTILSAILRVFLKNKKRLHLEILTVTFGSAALMFLVDTIVAAISGDSIFDIEHPNDMIISILTLVIGICIRALITTILNKKVKSEH